MLLKSFNRATQCPELLVSDILNGNIAHPEERLAATEMLGFVDDINISMPAFEQAFYNGDSLHLESALVALRTLQMRQGSVVLSRKIKDKLIEIATTFRSPLIRDSAAHALADFRFA
jgi:hypothetical protein